MRGVRLADLREQLRAEIGHSTNPAVGVNAKDYLDQVLRRTQDRLWEEFDWSHLKVSRDIEVYAGQRYYSVPDDLHYERITEVSFKYGGDWIKLTHGINESDYNTYDSDNGEMSYPVCKWDVAEDTGAIDDTGVIEIWPLPANPSSQLTGGLRLTGYRKIGPLNVDSDKCELDGTLIVLTAAAEMLARQKQADATIKLTMAENLRTRLMGNTSNKKKTTSFGGGGQYDGDCGPRPRIIGSVTSLGGGGNSSPTPPEGPPYDLSQNYINDLVNVQGAPSNGWVLTYNSTTGQWEPKAPVTVDPSDGVEEAPEDGNTYGRKDADWEVIATQTGDYLPRNGTLPMEGPLEVYDNNKAVWYSDAGVTERVRIGVSDVDGDINRAKVRLFDVDGNTGDDQAVIDIRSETDSSEMTIKSAVVLAPSQAGSDVGKQYTGYIGYNRVDFDGDYAQFGIQGTPEDYPNDADRRRAWFGTDWSKGGDPAAKGLNNVQLYINRPQAGGNYFIDTQVDGTARFQVNHGGWLWSGGPGRFGERLDNDVEHMFQLKKGVGIEIGYHTNQLNGLSGGVIQVKDRDPATTVYKPMFLYGSEFHFNLGAVESDISNSDVRVWPNPDSVTQGEFALFNKAQMRIYKGDGSDTTDRVLETIGADSAANGLRVIKWDGSSAAITMAAQSSGINFIDISGTDAQYRINGERVGFLPTVGLSSGDSLRYWNGEWQSNRAFQQDNTNNAEVFATRPNQYVSGVDEIALLNDAQIRSYDAQGKRQWESIGGASDANGIRVIQYNADTAGITLGCTSTNASFVDVTGSTAEYRINGVKANYASFGAASVDHVHTNYVETTGNQTINGVKTFGSIPQFNAGIRISTSASIPSSCSIYAAKSFGAQSLPITTGGSNAAWGYGILGYETCDVRLKENIRDMPYGLEEILQMEPISFEWRHNGVTGVGFSAQDLHEIMPEAAPYEEETDRWGIASTPLIAALVHAVHELTDRIVMLEKRQ